MQLHTKLSTILALLALSSLAAGAQQYPSGGRDSSGQTSGPYQQNQGYPGATYQPQSYPASGYPQGYPAQNYPPQGYPPQPYPAQGFPPQESVPQPGYYPAGYNGNGLGSVQPGVAQAKLTAGDQAKVSLWFQKYDDVRRKAQMSPNEKQQADSIMSKGLSILLPGPDKIAAKEIMTRLVGKYDLAVRSLDALQAPPQTKRLHQGYAQYFATARGLFSDYLRVQDNLMARDSNGQPIMSQLMQRKMALENLEHSCKELDAATRAQFGIAAYQY